MGNAKEQFVGETSYAKIIRPSGKYSGYTEKDIFSYLAVLYTAGSHNRQNRCRLFRGKILMKKIVIIGATSMTGIVLLEKYIKNNIEVLAIIRKISVHRNRIPSSDPHIRMSVIHKNNIKKDILPK